MTSSQPPRQPDERQKRLAAALRDNLRRRKAQARARAEPAPETGEDAAEAAKSSPSGREKNPRGP